MPLQRFSHSAIDLGAWNTPVYKREGRKTPCFQVAYIWIRKQHWVEFWKYLHWVGLNLWNLKSEIKRCWRTECTWQLNPVLLWILQIQRKILSEEALSTWCNVCCDKHTPQTWGQKELESQDVNIKPNTFDLLNPVGWRKVTEPL